MRPSLCYFLYLLVLLVKSWSWLQLRLSFFCSHHSSIIFSVVARQVWFFWKWETKTYFFSQRSTSSLGRPFCWRSEWIWTRDGLQWLLTHNWKSIWLMIRVVWRLVQSWWHLSCWGCPLKIVGWCWWSLLAFS